MLKSNCNIFFLFLLLGFLLYGNTLGHDFTLDDAIVITDNSFTKKGFSGIWDQLSNDQFVGFYGEKKELVSGGRYRPLSMVVFNIQYALAGESAFVGHLVNLLFYVLNGFLLFLVLQKLLLKFSFNKVLLSFPLLASLLWFFHPIHTEVVANIKGLDEIMAFSFELLCLYFILLFLEKNAWKNLALSLICYFLALLSKENAITWLAIIPLSIYFFTSNSFKKALPAYIGLLVVAVGWLYIRYKVVGSGISNVADNLMNDPFLESSAAEKYATIVLTLGKYLQLLFFPHPLTFDYYPKHIPIVNWTHPAVIFSILAYLLLLLIAIKGFFQRSIYAYGILIFTITLSIASNLLFPIGAFMNERFVYVSSLGFSLILAYIILQYLPSVFSEKKALKNAFTSLLSIVLLLYSVKTISRNQVWKNNISLATHDAEVSLNGAKSNVMAGGLLTEEAQKTTDPAQKKALLERALNYLNRAVSIYPEYIDALLLMGNAQWEYHHDASLALPYYVRILNINPSHTNTWQNAMIILDQEKNVDYRIKAYEKLLQYRPNEAKIYLRLGRVYGQEKQQLNTAQLYLEKGRELSPNNEEILSNLGTLYGIQQNYSKAIEVLEKAVSLQSNNPKLYVDLGLSYYYVGQAQKAEEAFNKAMQLDPKIRRDQFPQ
jgi:tetratricopeptide (TPR) repeat protein